MDDLLLMTDMEYETWSQPFLNSLLILELVHMQAFSEASAIPSDWSDVIVVFYRYTGMDADDLTRISGHWYNIHTGSNEANQYGSKTHRAIIVTDMLRYAFTSQCLFDPDLTLPFDDACLSNIPPRRRFGYVLDHYGGKLYAPTHLGRKSVPFMINELVNYLMPLHRITDSIRTINQRRRLAQCRGKKPEDYMVERDFDMECDYSEEREDEMESYNRRREYR